MLMETREHPVLCIRHLLKTWRPDAKCVRCLAEAPVKP